MSSDRDRSGEGSGNRLAEKLTAAEQRVASLVSGGATNREAAITLFVGRKTIEAHLSSVYRKLGVRSRSELARTWALADGPRSTPWLPQVLAALVDDPLVGRDDE